MLHYFLSLPKNNELDFNTNLRVSLALKNRTYDALTPFYQYLKTALDTVEKKESIKAKWRKMEEQIVRFVPQGYLYKLYPSTRIQLDNRHGWYWVEGIEEECFDEPLIYRLPDKTKKELAITPDDIVSLGDKRLLYLKDVQHRSFEKVLWNMDSLTLTPAWIEHWQVGDMLKVEDKAYKIIRIEGNTLEIQGVLPFCSLVRYQNTDIRVLRQETAQAPAEQATYLEQNEDYTLIWSKDKLLYESYPFKQYIEYDDIAASAFPQASSLWEELSNDFTFRYSGKEEDYKSEIGKTYKIKGILFKTQKADSHNQDYYWIQLLEEEDEQEEDAPSGSPLKYFFEDEIEIEDSNRIFYTVEKGEEQEFKLLLRKKEQGGRGRVCYPEGAFLNVKINTHQLRKQLESIKRLQEMPVGEHAYLVRLFELYKGVKWPWFDPMPLSESGWWVLKDNARSGAYEQREFVQKSLATPDFAILEGPPGSGKTTVILELICQLAQRNKRILLCGSTHVAIDNVLEKLNEERGGTTLLQQLDILPIRIGDERRIGENVKQFQFQTFVKDNHIREDHIDLLLESANLVCGTTIGILQHPHLKQNRKDNRPIVPEFDYLIIDESSKTTFQEFLVPALFAKRWILVGDVMQLAPFSDREQLVSSLENIPLKGDQTFEKWKQDALYYLYKIKELFHTLDRNGPPPLQLAFSMDQQTLKVVQQELEARPEQPYSYRLLDQVNHNALELLAYDVLFIHKNCLREIAETLPEPFLLLNYGNWESTSYAFRIQHWISAKGFSTEFKERQTHLSSPFEIIRHINTGLKEKSWAEEIAWRIDREFQLRLRSHKTANYQQTIEELMPKSDPQANNIRNRINTIANIALPSILECLIKGIQGRRTDVETTISKGFDQPALANRYSILQYQHRMHGDISNFPRRQFYQNNERQALQDLQSPQPINSLRHWDYTRYPHRNVWKNVEGITRRNYNYEEINDRLSPNQSLIRSGRNYNYEEINALLKELEAFVEYALKHPQPEGKTWSVACLTFYRGQEKRMRDKLREWCKMPNAISQFYYTPKIHIKLHTVDKIQGQEADVVFLSMVQNKRDGFLDNPNRLNVAITRAKFQLVVLGDWNYFAYKSRSEDLKAWAKSCTKI